MEKEKAGWIYVVATPIGNLKDMSLRGIEILQQVDQIAAEDTRHAASLLKHYSIQKPMISMHEFNERERLNIILDKVKVGQSIALISDAGTPLISDPGFHLIKAALAQGVRVIPVPGPCAAIAALSVAGLPTDRFIFEGFLPAKTEARYQRLKALSNENRTLIFYEAPHRLLASLEAMKAVFGADREGVIAREMTKIYESILKGSLNDLIDWYSTHPQALKGEVVVVIQGADEEKSKVKEVVPEEVLAILLKELPVKQAVALAAQITKERKNVLYEWALTKKDVDGS